ncbi:MAG: lumazine-binding protein [Flavipsychrobacter sp.]|jgi:hypothetical protein|nr:lumazine-binding protein [Flavipsychrobacter sp.]
MRKILLSLSVIIIAAMLLVSCSKSSPKEVAKNWLTSFYHLDYEAARKLSTDETKKYIGTLEELGRYTPDSLKKEMEQINVVVKDERIEGDSLAFVTYNLVMGKVPDAPRDETLKLVKKDGKWLVLFSKNDGIEAAEEEEPTEATSPADTTGASAAPAEGDTTKHE